MNETRTLTLTATITGDGDAATFATADALRRLADDMDRRGALPGGEGWKVSTDGDSVLTAGTTVTGSVTVQ